MDPILGTRTKFQGRAFRKSTTHRCSHSLTLNTSTSLSTERAQPSAMETLNLIPKTTSSPPTRARLPSSYCHLKYEIWSAKSCWSAIQLSCCITRQPTILVCRKNRRLVNTTIRRLWLDLIRRYPLRVYNRWRCRLSTSLSSFLPPLLSADISRKCVSVLYGNNVFCFSRALHRHDTGGQLRTTG